MAAQGTIYVTNVTETDVAGTYKVSVRFDVAFNYGGWNRTGSAWYTISCYGQSTGKVSTTFSVASGNGTYRWANIGGTKVFTVKVPNTSQPLTFSIDGYLYTGIKPLEITATDTYTIPASTTSDGGEISDATTYRHVLGHWAYGFKNGDGTNSAGTAYQIHEHTEICTTTSNQTYTVTANHAVAIPKGFYLHELWGMYETETGTEDTELIWTNYAIGTSLIHNRETYAQFFYYPIEYPIIYNLDGGEITEGSPTSYTILYEEILENPVKEGYTFTGWTNNAGEAIVSVNTGMTASFTDANDLYTQLASRKVGPVSVYAHWIPNGYFVAYDGNGSDSGNVVNTTHIYDDDSTLAENAFEREGYVFKGWNTAQDGSGQFYSAGGKANNIGKDDGEIVFLYAVWVPKKMYLFNDGTIGCTEIIER